MEIKIKPILGFNLTPLRIIQINEVYDSTCQFQWWNSLLLGEQTGTTSLEIGLEVPQETENQFNSHAIVLLMGIYPNDSISYYRYTDILAHSR